MKQLHDLQIKILQNLLFANGLRYSQLKPIPEIENNKLSFHLNKLIEYGFVTKDNEAYFLSDSGKEYANRIGTDLNLKLQAKVSVIVVATRHNDTEVLVYTRLKQPFYGCQGHLSGKVGLGESIYEAAERELKEETNLDGSPTLFMIRHSIVFNAKTQQMVEDKILFCFVVHNATGELNFLEEGHFAWTPLNVFRQAIKKPFLSLNGLMAFTDQAIQFRGGMPPFDEKISYTDHF